MKIALCQINTTLADFKGNQAKILKGISRAKQEGASLAVFPELAVFGYPPRDLLDKPYLIDANLEAAENIARETTKNFAVVFGFVSKNETGVGRGLFNAAAFAADGRIRYVQPKTLLPTYDVFDEARHFDMGAIHLPQPFQGHAIGLTVCEDIWSVLDFYGKRYYQFDPVASLKEAKADCIINISASPFHLGKRNMRRELLCKTALKNSLPVVFCNLVGGNDELVFDGQSMVVDREGKILFEGRRFEEDFAVVDLNKTAPLKKLSSPPDIEEVHRALILGLQDYARKCHFKKAVIGLSGGIDSSVVASLAVEALGPKNVTGVSMPSPYSSKGSVADAKSLAKNLKIPLQSIPIDDVYRSYLKTLKMDVRKKIPLAAENVQARIRGNILMAISNQTGALVLSTGNKSEMACGYCTLYGDLTGGLALLSDLPKTQVYELAHFINRKRKQIPEAVFNKPPSAELRPNQKDEDSLPSYAVLDPILKYYVEEHLDTKAIIAKGFPQKTVEKIVWMVNHNEYKRRQSPPGIKVTSKAFGMGRRFPIAWEYRR
ncbi:MAG: NAD+ synthase [Deltaproteobacteria bacterium]|nr:NAD+ synthase [Deltaproteobacteria bacterium]